MVFTMDSHITKLWGLPLLFCEQLTCLCLRSNWPRLSHPPVYRNVYCWLSWWKNRSRPPVTFLILSIFHPVQSHRLILIEVTITLFLSTTTKKLTLRAVSIQSAAGRNFSRISSLSSSLKTSGLFKDKDKDYIRLWKHGDQVRQSQRHSQYPWK